MTLKDVLPDLLAALGSLLAVGLTYAVTHLASYIKAKVANETLQNILIRTDTVVFSVVKELSQTVVDTAKKDAADGKLASDIAADVKAAALAKVKSYLGQPGLDALMEILGIKDMPTADALLSSKIEAAVRDTKTSVALTTQALSAAPAPNP